MFTVQLFLKFLITALVLGVLCTVITTERWS